jgi:hypothetical protein
MNPFSRRIHPAAVLAIALGLLCITGIVNAQTAWNTNTITWAPSVGCTSGPATGCPVTGYRVERAASQTGTFAAVGTASSPPFIHTSAAAGLNCYRIIALSAVGNSAPSTVTAASCRTNVEPSGPPNPPTDVRVIETTAFNVKPNYQRFAFERGTKAGTIRLGAACDESRVTSDGYTVISRPSQVIPRPQTGVVLVAKCG